MKFVLCPLQYQRGVGPMGCRTNGLSDQWAVGPMGCRTNGLSDHREVTLEGTVIPTAPELTRGGRDGSC